MTAPTHLNAYNTAMCNELYNSTLESVTTAGPATAQLQAAYAQAWATYLEYANKGTTTTCSAPTGRCPAAVPAP